MKKLTLDALLQSINEDSSVNSLIQSSPVCHKIFDPDFKLQFLSNSGVVALQIENIEDYYGHTFPTDAAPKITRDIFNEHLHLAAKGETNTIEYSFDVDGNVLWYRTTLSPFFNTDGNLIYIRADSMDITERKLAEEALHEAHDNLETRVEQRTTELKLSNEELKKEIIERQRAEKTLKNTYKQLLHSEKLAALGKLSASFAHEFNNPLTVVIRSLDHISDTLHLDKNNQKLFHSVNKECVRMASMVQKLLDFHKPSSGEIEHVDIHTLIDEILLLQESALNKKSIKFKKHYAPQMPKIRMVPDQIKQVLLNLVQNAEEAITGEDGMITISTENTGDQIKIKIQDSGAGIPPQNLESVFDPFFSTKKNQQGMGLGLSISFGIAQAHGGILKVESEPSAGTTFTLALPRKG